MYQSTRFNNIYKTNGTYRVRLMRNGKKFSKYCKTCKEALSFRNLVNSTETV